MFKVTNTSSNMTFENFVAQILQADLSKLF